MNLTDRWSTCVKWEYIIYLMRLIEHIDLGWGYAIIIIWKDNNNLWVKRKPNERRQRGLKLEFRKMEWKVVRERERGEDHMRVWKGRRVGPSVDGNDWCHVVLWKRGCATCWEGKAESDAMKGGDSIRCLWRWRAGCPCGPQAEQFPSLSLSPPRKENLFPHPTPFQWLLSLSNKGSSFLL